MIIPTLDLGPLNALVASIKDSGIVQPGTSDHHPYVLSCISFGALNPFGSKAIVYLDALASPSRGGVGPLGP